MLNAYVGVLHRVIFFLWLDITRTHTFTSDEETCSNAGCLTNSRHQHLTALPAYGSRTPESRLRVLEALHKEPDKGSPALEMLQRKAVISALPADMAEEAADSMHPEVAGAAQSRLTADEERRRDRIADKLREDMFPAPGGANLGLWSLQVPHAAQIRQETPAGKHVLGDVASQHFRALELRGVQLGQHVTAGDAHDQELQRPETTESPEALQDPPIFFQVEATGHEGKSWDGESGRLGNLGCYRWPYADALRVQHVLLLASMAVGPVMCLTCLCHRQCEFGDPGAAIRTKIDGEALILADASVQVPRTSRQWNAGFFKTQLKDPFGLTVSLPAETPNVEMVELRRVQEQNRKVMEDVRPFQSTR